MGEPGSHASTPVPPCAGAGVVVEDGPMVEGAVGPAGEHREVHTAGPALDVPLFPVEAPEACGGPLPGPPGSYARTYARRPVKAARALAYTTARAAEARAAGDEEAGARWDREAAGLDAVLAGMGSCRQCGRALRNPESVALGIGPECRRGGP